jgi:hypothetical protein
MLTIALMALSLSSLSARFSIYAESGVAFTGYNDARSPGDLAENNTFSFVDDLESDPVPQIRLNAHYQITPRHQVSLLYTPLRVRPEGTFDRDIEYEGETFLAGEPIEALYRFDSYRLQYRYLFKNQNMIIRSIGASLKLRDAEIYLKSGAKKGTKTNTGLVPLISFKLGYDITPRLALNLDGEALASKFGRAEDVLASVDYKLNERFTLKGGYRILEGGSDIDEVYTFALFNYAVLGLEARF